MVAQAEEQYATLDSMILKEERVVSFRTLSSELKIPVKQAQNILSEYLSNRSDKVVASWAVTSEEDYVRKVKLVHGERPSVKGNVLYVAVWGVVSSKADVSADDWMRCDRLREIRMVDTLSCEVNELQDNRWNPIHSDSAGWTLGGSAAQARDRMEAITKEKARALKLKQDTGTVAKVKAEAAEKLKMSQGPKKSSFQFNRSNSKNGVTQKSIASRSIASATKKKKQDPAPPPVMKKTRRVVEISDDEDDSDESDDDAERLAMEAEADEADRAALERKENAVCVEQNEVTEVPVKKSKSNSTKQTRSTANKEKKLSEQEKEDRDTSSLNGKRDFRTYVGGKTENQSKYRMIEVEETVQLADGYIGTRRVKKYVDKDGNEKPAQDGGTVENEKSENPSGTNGTRTLAPNNPTKRNPTALEKKKEATPSTKAKAATGGGKSSKRGNGSILSFFSKKN